MVYSFKFHLVSTRYLQLSQISLPPHFLPKTVQLYSPGCPTYVEDDGLEWLGTQNSALFDLPSTGIKVYDSTHSD